MTTDGDAPRHVFPHDAMDQLMCRLGYVVAATARVEVAMKRMHSCLLCSPVGYTQTVGESFDAARQGCSLLLPTFGDDIRLKVEPLLKEAAEVWRLRKMVVHVIWGSVIGTEHIAALREQRGAPIERTDWTPEALREVELRAGKASADLLIAIPEVAAMISSATRWRTYV